MANTFVQNVIKKIEADFGNLKKIGAGNSLYEISSINTFVYFRYSKMSSVGGYTKGFFGLRNEDLKIIKGKTAFLCFVLDEISDPILIPFRNYEYDFGLFPPSTDGQYKVLLFFKNNSTEFYISNVGRYNVDAYYGLSQLYAINNKKLVLPDLSHSQIQSLLGAIGIKKGYDLWVPESDKCKLDTNIIDYSKIKNQLPRYSIDIDNIISEIDVIWLENHKPVYFFEVEHSTPIYSGLLRFNDVLLTVAGVDNFNIVAQNEREGKFSKEIRRPTFKRSRLMDKVTFLDYENIYHWYYNLYGTKY